MSSYTHEIFTSLCFVKRQKKCFTFLGKAGHWPRLYIFYSSTNLWWGKHANALLFVSNSSLCFCIIFDHELVGRDLLCTWSAHSYPSSATFARVVQAKGNGTVCPKILFEEQCMLRHLTLHCIKQTLDDTKHNWNTEELSEKWSENGVKGCVIHLKLLR